MCLLVNFDCALYNRPTPPHHISVISVAKTSRDVWLTASHSYRYIIQGCVDPGDGGGDGQCSYKPSQSFTVITQAEAQLCYAQPAYLLQQKAAHGQVFTVSFLFSHRIGGTALQIHTQTRILADIAKILCSFRVKI